MSSSVLPLNMDPQITSILPRRSPLVLGSINIVKVCYDIPVIDLIGKQFVTLKCLNLQASNVI
jgi:hypothetical protein